MELDRRSAMQAVLGLVAAGLLPQWGLAAVAGKLTDEQFNLLTGSAKVPADYRRMAVHFRALAAEHEAEAKMWDEVANSYKKRRPAGTTQAQADDLARDLKHAAEHSRDTAEAVIYVAEALEGMADHFKK
jgi:hypothetical protein